MKSAAIGFTLLALIGGNAFARDAHYLDSEQAFREVFGKRATRVAAGVYEIQNRNTSVSRFSFGEAGRAYEIGLMQARLVDLGTELSNATPGRRKLVNGLTAMLEQLLDTKRMKATNADSPPTHCVSSYSLEATVAPGFAYGSASARAGFTVFGPPRPHAAELHTFAYASSDTGTMESSDTRQFLQEVGAFSATDASATTGPSFTQFLEAYAYMNPIGCPNGFRSVSDYFDPY